MSNHIKETLVSVLRYSILNIRAASGNKDFQWLSYEMEHIKKLIDLFKDISLLEDYMNNTRKKYLEQISGNYENSYEGLWNELQKNSENFATGNLVLEEIDEMLIDVINIGVNNVLNFVKIKDYKNVFTEAYHIHNLPSIMISEKKEELIKYYLKVECKQYSKDADKTARKEFESIWKELRRIIKPKNKWLFFSDS